MGAGNRKESKQRQEGLSRTQEESGRFFMDQSKQELEQRRKVQAPVIDYYTQLASGDPTKIMAASAVPLGNLAKATQQARANIMEMAPGAARTAALGQLGRESGGQQASFLNQSYLSAFPALQGLATESASTGLSAAGAGYRGVEGAATTNKGIMDTQQAEKASQLGLVGSLAGMAGNIAGGALMKPAKLGTSLAKSVLSGAVESTGNAMTMFGSGASSNPLYTQNAMQTFNQPSYNPFNQNMSSYLPRSMANSNPSSSNPYMQNTGASFLDLR